MHTFKQYRNQPDFGCLIKDRDDWIIVPTHRNRDSNCWEESNFFTALDMLGGEIENEVEVHRFGHWACGWAEIILVTPHRLKDVKAIQDKLDQYPVLDEDDLCERQQEAADLTWKNCYSPSQRVEYIRKNKSQFDFNDWLHLLGCVRGKLFSGYASELIQE